MGIRRGTAASRLEASISDSNEREQAPRLAIVGGGTAGHVYPALAVAAAFRSLYPRAAITFLGTTLGLEVRLVAAAGFDLTLLPGAPFFGAELAGKLRAMTATVRAVTASRRLFTAESTEALLSFGGYASAGPVLAARRLGIPIAICEPNVAPGLTNRMLARFADEIFLGWPQAAAAFPSRSVSVTGVPVREPLNRRRRRAPSDADTEPGILIVGGSLGSSFLNRNVPQLMGELARRGCAVRIRHQTGVGGTDAVRAAYRSQGIEADLAEYIGDMAEAYEWADLAITSAGAVTLAELAVAALPAFIIPLAAASEDHQAANARAFATATGCPWVTEADWKLSSAADTVEALLRSPRRRAEIAAALAAAAVVDASAEIALRCDRLITRRRQSIHGVTR